MIVLYCIIAGNDFALFCLFGFVFQKQFPNVFQMQFHMSIFHMSNCPFPWHKGWTSQSLKVPSKPNHFMILILKVKIMDSLDVLKYNTVFKVQVHLHYFFFFPHRKKSLVFPSVSFIKTNSQTTSRAYMFGKRKWEFS